jgi:hypothetical protein
MSMVKRLLLASLVVLAGSVASAADGGLDGNYKFVQCTGAGEAPLALIKLETKDGKVEAAVLTAGPIGLRKVSNVKIDGKSLRFDMEGPNGGDFEGVLAGENVPGSWKLPTTMILVKLIKTSEDKLDNARGAGSNQIPEMNEVQALTIAPLRLQMRMQQEKDPEKKAELTKELAEAKEKAAVEVPKLYRKIMEAHGDTVAAILAGKALLASADAKPTPEEARKLIAAMNKVGAQHGPRMAQDVKMQIADALASVKNLKEVALEAAKGAESSLNDQSTTDDRSRVMKALLQALKMNGKTDDAKKVEEMVAKLETILDKEYMAKVPPFTPEKFAGRKDKSDRKVVMELFTGAQCPPCVAADVAFDALGKAYQPSELILLQYHLHIPGPDPMTNEDTLARAKFYSVNSTPNTIFNGKAAAGGGGGMANSETKFKQYQDIINKGLENTSDAKLQLTANKVGNKIDIKAEVSGVKDPDDKKRLRLVLVEESIRYVGGNKLRFHHHVVRALPGGADGFALKDANSQHSASVNLDELRAQIVKYLDTYAKETRPFPYPERPLDLKHLKVVGLIQNDETKEIVQVVQVDVGGEQTTSLESHK